jgi:WD40 repeat protein
MKIVKAISLFLILIIGAITMFNLFAHSLKFYGNSKPQADIKTYFNGPIKAWGIAQDWRGRVVNQFDIEMVGIWSGDTGTLTEKFSFYDGKKQERVWTIKKLADGKYEGTASDILNKATGETNGTAARWNYVMDLPVDNTTYRLSFDDWMWQMNDGVLINRSYIKKFGITVSELTIFMQKSKP